MAALKSHIRAVDLTLNIIMIVAVVVGAAIIKN